MESTRPRPPANQREQPAFCIVILHNCGNNYRLQGRPAKPDGTPRLGMRVRFSPDFYITRLISTSGWTGPITAKTKSMLGQRTRYTVELDPEFRTEAEETEVDALAVEMEPENDE